MTPVSVPCPCEPIADEEDPLGKPVTLRHPDGDTVELRDKLGLAAGIEIQSAVRSAIGQADGVIVGLLVEGYVRHGISGWSFVDDDGKPVEVTPENIQRWVLDDFTLASPIAEAADTLYEDAVLGPLVRAAATSSLTTPTESSTSPPDTGSEQNPTPSSPSLTTTTPTVVIETTSSSPDGVYKWSPTDPTDQLLEVG